MLMKFWNKKMQDDKGFTLIELMVVVLIIGILIAIALPTFLGLRERAQNRAAQSDLRNGLVAAKAFFTDDDSYTGFVADAPAPDENDGEGIEPSLVWNDGPTVVGEVSINVVNADEIVLTTLSEADDQPFCLASSETTGGGTARGDEDAATFATCGPDDW